MPLMMAHRWGKMAPMPTYIALLRAVNVGGRYYKMADLREHLTDSGLEDVETHIQTGNVRFRSSMRSPAKVEKHVENVLGEHCKFEVPSVIFTPKELRGVYDDAQRITPPPFGKQGDQRRYVTFFKAGHAPTTEVAQQIAGWDEPGESAVAIGRAVHVWLNHPSMEAKFFGAFKRVLAPGTNRDLKVVTKLNELWGS
jgi:uncharacterized protein (DUF1697 family)